MTDRDPAIEQPDRFIKAVRDACAETDDDNPCDYPDCQCSIFPEEVKIIIRAWDAHGETARTQESKSGETT